MKIDIDISNINSIIYYTMQNKLLQIYEKKDKTITIFEICMVAFNTHRKRMSKNTLSYHINLQPPAME